MQTFRAWLADLSENRKYKNIYKKPLSARSRRRAISSIKNFFKYSSLNNDLYKVAYSEIQLLKNPKIQIDNINIFNDYVMKIQY